MLNSFLETSTELNVFVTAMPIKLPVTDLVFLELQLLESHPHIFVFVPSGCPNSMSRRFFELYRKETEVIFFVMAVENN